MDDPATEGSRRRAITIALAAALLAVVLLRFAQPIEDGDIFWHMAYGRQILDRGTLVPDHALYSWMPASNDTIYCTWLSDLLFLGVWKAFGLAGIFGLRYAAILGVLALLVIYAHRRGSLGRPETWLAMLLAILASVVGTFQKPEMLSLVLWNALLFCWFRALLAIESNTNARPCIYAIPVLMLVWVNVHGGFILAAPFFAVGLAVAWIALPRRDAVHVTIAWVLSAAATLITPYGWRYPVELVNYTLGRTPRPDVAWNNAFQPTLSSAGNFHHLPELLIWMTAALAVAAVLRWRAARREALLCAALFLAYVPLYLLYVRSTFLLPAVFGYSFLFLMRDVPVLRLPRLRSLLPWTAAALFVFLGARCVYQARFRPEADSWMGFGISYLEPVDEAQFLKQGHFGPRIYNTFNAGGYLLWSLYPRYKVMVDARSFPYLSWFDELYQFTRTQDPGAFREFLERHPADVALVDFQEDLTWRSFLNTPGWRPAFYGPSAAVFAKAGTISGPVQAARSLSHLRNGAAGVKVFAFAISVGDYRTAWQVLDRMEGPLRGQVDPAALASAQYYRQGHAALRARDYLRAYDWFERAFRHRIVSGNDNTIMLLLTAEKKLEAAGRVSEEPTIRAGLAKLAAPE